jgi:serine/threonine-protein kinase
VERWQQVEEIFHEALQRGPGEREEYLRQACRDDSGLHREVASLLANYRDGAESKPWVANAAAQLVNSSTSLQPGQSLGPYRIESFMAAGGMGEVYRATDTRLHREVAIKVCAERFSERFAQEARVIASLNHPHICHLYDVGPNYLVMELVEGPTLADRIRQDSLPLEEALSIARQVAEALEAAHEKGRIHRDLKPANVKITPEGVVKLLDFGLAKAAEEPVAAGDQSNSPTVTISPTRTGVILGTAPYMSPEQARGKVVDKRADIWAFGCVLYEMLTGQQAFTGDTTTDILAAVMKSEPDLARVPVKVRRLLRRCLEKDPKKRLRDIGDAWELVEGEVQASAPLRSRLRWVVGALAIALAVTGAGWWRATRPVDRPLTRFSVDLGPDALPGFNLTAAISPDGRRLVFAARGPDGKQGLATRLLDQAQATLLPGTENGSDPFFSPDSQWIGFTAGGTFKKISVQGGAPVTLGTPSGVMGAGWDKDGNIVAALGNLVLSRIPAAGGPPQTITKLSNGEIAHSWPQVLRGGDVILFTASSTFPQESANIEAISLKTGQVKILLRGGYSGRYLPGGYLVYVRQGVLYGVPFDLERLEVRGVPTPLVEDVAANPLTGGGQFDFSSTGTLVYAAGKGAAQKWQLAWLDSSGKTQPLLAAPGAFGIPRLSPDGRKLAFQSDGDVYVRDLERDTTNRLTFTGHANAPVWTPDGKHIVFQSTSKGYGIYWMRSDGAGDPQPVLESQNLLAPWSFSPDGRRLAYMGPLVYMGGNAGIGTDLWTLPLDITDPENPKAGKPEAFLGTAAFPRFSPAGRWIAYRSNNEIYVRPYPAGSGDQWQISSGGGLYAVWANNGRELYYETADNRIMVVDYTVNGASFVPGKPRLWSDKQLFYPGTSNLDLTPDGKRFVVFTLPETPAGGEKGSVHVTVLENFFDEVRRRIP